MNFPPVTFNDHSSPIQFPMVKHSLQHLPSLLPHFPLALYYSIGKLSIIFNLLSVQLTWPVNFAFKPRARVSDCVENYFSLSVHQVSLPLSVITGAVCPPILSSSLFRTLEVLAFVLEPIGPNLFSPSVGNPSVPLTFVLESFIRNELPLALDLVSIKLSVVDVSLEEFQPAYSLLFRVIYDIAFVNRPVLVGYFGELDLGNDVGDLLGLVLEGKGPDDCYNGFRLSKVQLWAFGLSKGIFFELLSRGLLFVLTD